MSAQRPHHTYKEKVDKAKEVCRLYKEGYTLESCCKTVNIAVSTWYEWLKIGKIGELYKKTKIDYRKINLAKLKEKAIRGLEKRLNGEFYEEVTQIGQGNYNEETQKYDIVPKQLKKVKKYIPPSDLAIIFAMKKLDKEMFGDGTLPPLENFDIHDMNYADIQRIIKNLKNEDWDSNML